MRACPHCGKEIKDRALICKWCQRNAPPPASMEPPAQSKADRIQAQLQRLSDVSRLLGRKEIKELPNILWDDEEVQDVVQGFYSGGNGILVATDRRLVFVDKGMIYGFKVEDFPHDKISSLQYETGLMFGTITIFASGNKAVIANIQPKLQARVFAEGVRARISQPKADIAANAKQPSGLDDLERLAALKEKGVITEEEFSAKKRQILGI